MTCPRCAGCSRAWERDLNDGDLNDSDGYVLGLYSQANTEFVRFVDWARTFVERLEDSLLTPDEKEIVRRVLAIDESREKEDGWR